MNGRVFFTKGSAAPAVSRLLEEADSERCLCIYTSKSRVYSPDLLDLTGTGARFVPFSDYGKDTNEALVNDEEATMIVVGLSDMIRPSNRCDIRFEYMYNFARVGTKYVIDHVPFLLEKWRTWYPYGVIDPEILLYPHSYAIETAYRNYLEGYTDTDPLLIPRIIERIAPWTEINYSTYFPAAPAFAVHETTEGQRAQYLALKTELFRTCTTPVQIIRGLAKFCQEICPERTMPLRQEYLYKTETYPVIHMTDRNVDWYLRSEIERIIEETNQLTEGLYEAVHRG